MIPRKYYPQVMTVLMTLFMTIGMTVIMSLVVAGQLDFQTLAYDASIASIVALIANFIFPAGTYGAKLARSRGAEEGTFFYTLWMSVVPAVFNGLIMTAVMTGLKVGFNAAFIPAYFSTLWIGLIVGYLVSLLISPLATRLADVVTTAE